MPLGEPLEGLPPGALRGLGALLLGHPVLLWFTRIGDDDAIGHPPVLLLRTPGRAGHNVPRPAGKRQELPLPPASMVLNVSSFCGYAASHPIRSGSPGHAEPRCSVGVHPRAASDEGSGVRSRTQGAHAEDGRPPFGQRRGPTGWSTPGWGWRSAADSDRRWCATASSGSSARPSGWNNACSHRGSTSSFRPRSATDARLGGLSRGPR